MEVVAKKYVTARDNSLRSRGRLCYANGTDRSEGYCHARAREYNAVHGNCWDIPDKVHAGRGHKLTWGSRLKNVMKRVRHKRLLAALGFALALLGLAFGLDGLARHRLEKGWAMVQAGMSRTQVESILGTPANIYPAQVVQSDSFLGTLLGTYLLDTFQEKWAYGRRHLLVTQPVFPYVGLALEGLLMPEDEDYVVYFSAEGKVVRKVHPYRAVAPVGG